MKLLFKVAFISALCAGVGFLYPMVTDTAQAPKSESSSPELDALEVALAMKPGDDGLVLEIRLRAALVSLLASIKNSILNAKTEELAQVEEQVLTRMRSLWKAYLATSRRFPWQVRPNFRYDCDPYANPQFNEDTKPEFKYYSVLRAAAWRGLYSLVQGLIGMYEFEIPDKCHANLNPERMVRDAITTAYARGHLEIADYLTQHLYRVHLRGRHGMEFFKYARGKNGPEVPQQLKSDTPIGQAELEPLAGGPWDRDKIRRYLDPIFARIKAEIFKGTAEAEREAIRAIRHYKLECEKVGIFFDVRRFNNIHAYSEYVKADEYRLITLLAAAAWNGFENLFRVLVEECNPPSGCLHDVLVLAQNYFKKEFAHYLACVLFATNVKKRLIITDSEMYDTIEYQDNGRVETIPITVEDERIREAKQFLAQAKKDLAKVKNSILSPIEDAEKLVIEQIRALNKKAAELSVFIDFNARNFNNNDTKSEFQDYSLFQAAAHSGFLNLLRVLILECGPSAISICDALYTAPRGNIQLICYLKNVWATHVHFPLGSCNDIIWFIKHKKSAETSPDWPSMNLILAGIRWCRDNNIWSARTWTGHDTVVPFYIHRDYDRSTLLSAAQSRGFTNIERVLRNEFGAV